MITPTIWPSMLKPAAIMVNQVPFTRSGGKSLSGFERTTRTDRGSWVVDYKGIPLSTVARRRVWNGLRTTVGGMAGTLAIPIWSFDTAPWAVGTVSGKTLVPYDDDTPHDDGTFFAQATIKVTMSVAAALGDTSVTLNLADGIDELTGTRFSYQHALYELGYPTAVVDDLWTLPIFPAIRAAIPVDAELEFDLPTCLVRLAGDRQMDVSLNRGQFDKVDVSFVEATDAWNDLAAA